MSAEKAKEKMEKRTTEEKNNVTPKKGNFPRKNAKYHGTGQLPCPEIGENWTMEQVVRQQGKSAGRYDTYYYSPDGVKIRSRLKLQQHLNRNLDDFDYNTGKFIKNIVDKTSPSARGKMDKIKTSELKTIDRSPRSTKKSIINKQSRVRGPYSAALQMHKRRKKQKGLNKQRTQHNSKDMSTSAAIQKAIAIVDRDNVKKQPFILFRNEAMQLAGHFPDFDSDFEDLIICAWNCLSLESKKQYEECTYTGSPENVTNVYNTHNVGCSCNICNNDKKGKKRPYFSEMRRKRCGLCTGCRAKNCGSCDSCRDMKKFGGSGSRKQSCVLRRCVAIHSSKGCMRMVPRHLHTSPFSLTQSLVGSPPSASFLDYSPLIPLSYHSDGSLEKTSHRDLSEHDFEIICAKQIDCTDLTRNSGLLDADKIDTLPDSCQLSPQITSSNLTEYEIHGQKIVDVDPTVSNTSTDIPIISEQNISQKLHKRKSRIPVYIKQNEIEREVDILVE